MLWCLCSCVRVCRVCWCLLLVVLLFVGSVVGVWLCNVVIVSVRLLVGLFFWMFRVWIGWIR